MIRRGWRARAVLLGARCLRFLASQYATLLSAAVIAVLAVAAVTSDAFEDSGRQSAARYAELQKTIPRGSEIGTQYVQSLVWSPPGSELGLRSVVYYIYETESQREALESALNALSNSRFKLDEGGPEPTNVFVRASTFEEAASATREVALAAEQAKTLGYRFQVHDLRPAAGD